MYYKEPIALGIHWAHDSSAALCTQNEILFAIQEERLSRIKHHYGFPQKSIEKILDVSDIKVEDIDIVAFTSKNFFYPEYVNSISISADGIKKHNHIGFLKQIRNKINQNKILTCKYDDWNIFSDRDYQNYRSFLYEVGLMDRKKPFFQIHHHRCHASSAYRFSGLNNATIVTVDGKGDGLSSTINQGLPSGEIRLLRSSKAENSLGSFYQAITECLGFMPVDGEHKTMGLAAMGSELKNVINPFKNVIMINEGVLNSKYKWSFRDYNKTYPQKSVNNPLKSVRETDFFKPLLSEIGPEQFAYFAQRHCEDSLVALVKDAITISNNDRIVAAGGVMLNVKANALICEKISPSHFFIFPDSADSGLAAGAAAEALYYHRVFHHPIEHPKYIDSVYKGHIFNSSQINEFIKELRSWGKFSIKKCDFSMIADELCSQKVIGIFHGRMEMGPRALGNRSVIADPRSITVKDRINSILKGREWFVPFAPAIMDTELNKYFNVDDRYDYSFMTFAVKANEMAETEIPAVVHFDKTMRPQKVTMNNNPWFYKLISVFKEKTGVGVLLNTSFNRHGLPIVGSPHDALDHLINDWIDALLIDEYYIEKT